MIQASVLHESFNFLSALLVKNTFIIIRKTIKNSLHKLGDAGKWSSADTDFYFVIL